MGTLIMANRVPPGDPCYIAVGAPASSAGICPLCGGRNSRPHGPPISLVTLGTPVLAEPLFLANTGASQA